MIHYVPTDAVGHYTAPEGCIYLWVWGSPALTALTAPEGCIYLWIENCPALTALTAPEGCVVYLNGERIGTNHPLRRPAMSDLKPCPFCGSEARLLDDTSHSTAVWVGCATIGCFGHDQWEETEAEAIAAWNRRAAMPEVEALRAEVEWLRHQINEASDPSFIFGAMDNVHDWGVTLGDYADAVSRAIRAALEKANDQV